MQTNRQTNGTYTSCNKHKHTDTYASCKQTDTYYTSSSCKQTGTYHTSLCTQTGTHDTACKQTCTQWRPSYLRRDCTSSVLVSIEWISWSQLLVPPRDILLCRDVVVIIYIHKMIVNNGRQGDVPRVESNSLNLSFFLLICFLHPPHPRPPNAKDPSWNRRGGKCIHWASYVRGKTTNNNISDCMIRYTELRLLLQRSGLLCNCDPLHPPSNGKGEEQHAEPW